MLTSKVPDTFSRPRAIAVEAEDIFLWNVDVCLIHNVCFVFHAGKDTIFNRKRMVILGYFIIFVTKRIKPSMQYTNDEKKSNK